MLMISLTCSKKNSHDSVGIADEADSRHGSDNGYVVVFAVVVFVAVMMVKIVLLHELICVMNGVLET